MKPKQKGFIVVEPAMNGGAKVLRLMLDAGMSVNGTSLDSCSPLWYAVRKAQPDCVALLLERGADPTYVSNFNSSILDAAQQSGNARCIALIEDAIRNRQKSSAKRRQ